MRIGHGIYLNAHVNPPSSPWHIDRLGGTSAQRLAANLVVMLGSRSEPHPSARAWFDDVQLVKIAD